MTSRDFCFWLQGYFELTNSGGITEEQTDMIRRHLALVFKHEIDPSIPDINGELQEIHDGKPPKPPHSPLDTAFNHNENLLIRC